MCIEVSPVWTHICFYFTSPSESCVSFSPGWLRSVGRWGRDGRKMLSVGRVIVKEKLWCCVVLCVRFSPCGGMHVKVIAVFPGIITICVCLQWISKRELGFFPHLVGSYCQIYIFKQN
jgi:hypothetical protein